MGIPRPLRARGSGQDFSDPAQIDVTDCVEGPLGIPVLVDQ